MSELEKLTVNLSAVDVGRIELLVDQGFYANRAEFIRVAIHDQLSRHGDALTDAAARQSLVMGAVAFDRRSLEKYRDGGTKIRIKVIGLASVAADVSPELAREVIQSVRVHGIFKASPQVKQALADRME